MIKFLAAKLVVLIPTFLGISILAFGLIRLVEGDPVELLIGERGASPEVMAEMRASLGLDKPVIEQYFIFVSNALQGDLGVSIVSKRPVTEEFFARFPATVELGLAAIFLATIFGIPMGIFAAVRRNSIFDYLLMGGALVGFSMPIFWWGLILILVFSVGLGWTPVAGRIGALYDVESVTGFMLIDVFWSEEGFAAFKDVISHLILPAVALGTIPLAIIARMTRSSMLEVLKEDYMRTARAKGLGFYRVVFVHGLRNALIPVVTVIGLTVGTILTGAILTETIFSWPGIGKWIVNSVNSRDYPVIQGGILCIATVVMMVNLGVDFMYALINPKMRATLK